MLPTLRLLDWPDSLDKKTASQFTEQTGAQIELIDLDNATSVFDALVADEPPDLIVPASYTVQELIERDNMLLPLEHALLPNLEHLEYMLPGHVSHDPHYQYSVPSYWGTTGIVYRDDLITEPIESWADFWEVARAYPEQTSLLDDPHDVINAALKRSGYSLNETDPAALDAAEAALLELRPYIGHRVTDYKSLFAHGEIYMALSWNGDAAVMQQMGIPVRYVVPKEGSELWEDNYVIPANARHPELAHQFINFLMEPEIDTHQIMYTLYPTYNATSIDMLPEAVRDNPIVFPPRSDLQRVEFATLLPPETRQRRAEIWERFITT